MFVMEARGQDLRERYNHRPVLLRETLELLLPERGGLFIDGTLGLGGHGEAVLEASASTRLLGIDRDPEAIRSAKEQLSRFGPRFRGVAADFRELPFILKQAGEELPNGVLVDLGVSSMQLDAPERGFSFRHDAPLDMRMNNAGDEETAAELLARLPEEEIARIIYEYGEERRSRRIARRIVERRERGERVETTKALAELVAGVVGYKPKERIHPATRTFQALRIAVNHELEGLGEFVEIVVDLLQPTGRFVVISFHSLEDRIVKHTLRRLSGICECSPRAPVCSCGARRRIEILTKKPVAPSDAEQTENPRARSAKLRACAKL